MKLCANLQTLPCDYRLFIYRQQPSQNTQEQFLSDKGYLVGAGIKAYPMIVGPVFVILGIATKIFVDSHIYYVNIQSFKKFFYRMFVVMPTTTSMVNKIQSSTPPRSPLSKDQNSSNHFKVNFKVWVHAMHQKYLDLQITGYDPKILKLINCKMFFKSLF